VHHHGRACGDNRVARSVGEHRLGARLVDLRKRLGSSEAEAGAGTDDVLEVDVAHVAGPVL
jgi:hypothetical protein